MSVIRSAYYDRIDLVAHLIEHLAEIVVPLGVGPVLERSCCAVPIHVAQGDNVLAVAAGYAAMSLAARTNARDIQFLVRGVAERHAAVAEEQKASAADCGAFQESSTGHPT